MLDNEKAVLAAADRLVGAFAGNDRDAYFAAFAPDATFVFHNLGHRLECRADYEKEWDLWVSRDGFRVVDCRSSERRVQLAGDVAIFTHHVETDVEIEAVTVRNLERETIVFRQTESGGWIAIHEHLSPAG